MTRHRTTATSRGTAPPKPDPVEAAATALAAVGPVTAAQLASHLGVAYPTITPRLRRLETDGRAERIKEPGTGRTLWHTTPPTTPPGTGTPNGDGGPGETDHAPGETTTLSVGEAAPDIDDTADAQSTPDTTAHPSGPPAASTPLSTRRELLTEVLDNAPLAIAVCPQTGDVAVADNWMADWMPIEGVMIKAAASRYRLGTRGRGWLKRRATHTSTC
jgi:ATP dependent DNA ligase domain